MVLQAVSATLVSAALLFGPGLIVGSLIRLRGLWLWALAPAISTTLLAAGAIVLPWIGATWNPVTALLFTAVSGAIVVLLFRVFLRARFNSLSPTKQVSSNKGAHWPTIVAWAIPAILLSAYTLTGVGSFDNISQTFDNVFHLNAIALITESGNASPFEIAKLTSPDGGQGFYPNGWHLLVQLAQQLSASTIPIAINGFNLAVIAIVWPLGVLLLARQFTGASRTSVLVAGIIAAAVPAFPLLMLHYGVLYPFFFGLALAPATLAVVINLLGIAREPRVFNTAPLVVLLAGTVPAIAIAHPGAMMAVLALTVPCAAVACFAGWHSIAWGPRSIRLAGFAVFGLVGFVLMDRLRPEFQWGPRMGRGEALLQTVLLNLWGYGFPLVTAAIVIIGLVTALRRSSRTSLSAAGIWAVGAAMYVVTAGIWNPLLRIPIQIWYGDAPRLAAVFAIALIPVAVIGATWLINALTSHRPKSWTFEATLLAVLLISTQLTAGYGKLTDQMRDGYTADTDAALLTDDEIALLERLPDSVGAEEMIATNPWTGGSLAFAFAGREVVLPHILMNDVSRDRSTVMDSLRDAASDPQVCEAADRLGVRWVLDFGDREVHGDQHEYSGIENIDDSTAFELVDSEGEARLYRLTACD